MVGAWGDSGWGFRQILNHVPFVPRGVPESDMRSREGFDCEHLASVRRSELSAVTDDVY